MKSLVTALILTIFSLSAPLSAQFYAEPFNDGLNGWEVGAIGFEFDENGEAEDFLAWGNRSRIQSESLGGAMIFTGPGNIARVISPSTQLPIPAPAELWLSFHHYFSIQDGQVNVQVKGTDGTSIDVILEQGLVTAGESSSGEYHLINLGALTQSGSLTIQFGITGSVNFLIIDDVQLSVTRPPLVTFPRYLGDSLIRFGFPFIVDETGAPAVPFQLVADMLPGFTEAEYQMFRDMLGATLIRRCVCDRLEVWEMPGGVFFDPATGEPLGNPSQIYGNTLPSQGMNKVDGLDLNYYNYNELKLNEVAPNLPLTPADVSPFIPAPADAIKIAVLDTGLDLDHPDLNGYVFRNPDDIGNDNDDDNDCLIDNPLGWNFVDDNNNPNDDNGHGTHVSGIIANSLNLCDDCVVQLIPYKTHDNFGVGTLFASACATLQASVMDGADVINASWGFYGGGGSTILKNAIDTAQNYGTLFIAAVGNDMLNLNYDPQYPALYDLGNVLAVGAHDTLPGGLRPFAAFSNFSNDEVDLAAFGVDVESAAPGGGTALKSGTSMAAPMVSAAACLYGCENGFNPVTASAYILANAFNDSDLSEVVIDGKALDVSAFCTAPLEETGNKPAVAFSIRFRPGSGIIDIISFSGRGRTEIEVFDTEGGLVVRRAFAQLNARETIGLSMEAAPAGMYLVVIQTGGRVFTQRLVKR
ncbi:MAG: S8 family peptidase [Lewinella sp.]|nr:S8 family peptidase [Lewinella sp.]